jgi:hypothetical protein
LDHSAQLGDITQRQHEHFLIALAERRVQVRRRLFGIGQQMLRVFS